jgi:plasmid stabilization system protein ParE
VSVDTEIKGDPAAVQRVGTWLKEQLATKVGAAADAFNSARSAADGSWNGVAGEEFVSTMKRGRDTSDDLEGAAKKMGEDVSDFGEKLKTCQDDMTQIRDTARGAGLTVSGFLVQDPGAGPARPPSHFEGTEAEVAAYEKDVTAYNEHQELIEAYHHAESEAARIDRKYATACRELQDEYTVGTHAAWLVSTAEVIGDGAAASVASTIASKKSALHGRAQSLVAEAQRAIDDLQAHPEQYLKRKWLFFKELDAARLEADRLAIAGRLDEAEDLLRQSSHLDDAKLPKFLGRAGRVLGPVGLGIGIYNDYQEGESTTQIAVSQGVSFGAGLAAGAGTGALIGSIVPGPGTAIGAVVGGIVGAGVSIFSDGAIDSFFENGPDVGKALEEGVDALADTGEAIADGVGGAIDTVGGWFS